MKKLIYTLTFVLILYLTFNIENCSAKWQPDVRLTNDSASSSTSHNNAWCVASSGSVVHVVWYDDRDGNDEIYYKRSTDAGVSLGADTRLTIDAAVSYLPSVAVSGSIVHVVWEDRLTCKLGVLCFYSSSVLADSFVLRNRQLLVARNRYSALILIL